MDWRQSLIQLRMHGRSGLFCALHLQVLYIYILPENLQLKTALMVFELPLDIIVAPLPHELYQELDSECRGPVYLRGDPKYVS